MPPRKIEVKSATTGLDLSDALGMSPGQMQTMLDGQQISEQTIRRYLEKLLDRQKEIRGNTCYRRNPEQRTAELEATQKRIMILEALLAMPPCEDRKVPDTFIATTLGDQCRHGDIIVMPKNPNAGIN